MQSLFSFGTVSGRLAAALVIVAAWTAQSHAADPYAFNIISTADTDPGQCPSVTFSVTNTATGQLTILQTNPDWTGSGAGLRLHFGWDTGDFNNKGSNTNLINVLDASNHPALPNPLFPNGGVPFARGAAYPIPVSVPFKALATTTYTPVFNGYCTTGVIYNGNGTYTAMAPLPIPLTATGSGRVIMEGHPALKDANGEFVPIKSAYLEFPITDASAQPRRLTVDIDNKCMVCHRSDGTGFKGTGEPGRLTLHGRNRTEKLICPVCHNPNQTDVQRRIASDAVNYPVRIGSYTYAEQSVDFKRLIHGIKATSVDFRENPLVVLGPILQQNPDPTQPPYPPAEAPFIVDADEPGFGRYVFDTRKVSPFPAKLRNCLNCHIDDGTHGTFELPVGYYGGRGADGKLVPSDERASKVLGSTVATGSTPADGLLTRLTVNSGVINADPDDNDRITPTAAVCSACHDKNDAISHMVQAGNASFRAKQSEIGYMDHSGNIIRNAKYVERCVTCHGPGKDKSVRKVHDISSGN